MHHNRSEVIHLELIKLLISHDRESQQIENFTGMLFHDQDLSKYTAKLGSNIVSYNAEVFVRKLFPSSR
jgi:hypothetical protein